MKNCFLLFCFCTSVLFSQEINDNYYQRNKGKVYVYWGWNRGYYSDSDIQFRGENYNFTLRDVRATDRQTPFSLDPYFTEITIPQTNFRLGYFITDNYEVSFGIDHMKYVMVQDQKVGIDGYIDEEGNTYNGVYNNNPIVLSEEFLKFEHTDGLNYVNLELRRFDNWYSYKEYFAFNTTAGIGAGVLYPKTNTTLMGKERYDEFHISGYGLSSVVGINLNFFKYFFVQLESKAGFIDMPDIRTTEDTNDFASQNFWFLQNNVVVGVIFNILPSKGNKG